MFSIIFTLIVTMEVQLFTPRKLHYFIPAVVMLEAEIEAGVGIASSLPRTIEAGEETPTTRSHIKILLPVI